MTTSQAAFRLCSTSFSSSPSPFTSKPASATSPSSSPRASATLAFAATTTATLVLLLLSTAIPTTTAATAAASNLQTVSLRGSLGLLQQQQKQQQQQTASAFPPGAMCERSAANSPLRLSLDAVASDAGASAQLRRYCFRLDNAGGCDSSSRCCQQSAARASKIEFDVVAGCKDALRRVTINGKPSPYMYDVSDAPNGVLRISGLGAATAAAAAATGGDQICVYLDAASACPSLSQLCTRHSLFGGAASGGAAACRYSVFNADQDCCPVSYVATRPPLTPPPPPPPQPTTTTTVITATTPLPTATATATPRAEFPYFQCRRDAAGSRLFASVASALAPNSTSSSNTVAVAATNTVTAAAGDLTRICFDVGLRESCPDPTSPCCEFNLYKVEIEVDAACADSLAYTTIDGIQHVRFLQMAPHAAVKIVNLDRPASAVNGTRVCLFLRPACNTLAKLCARHDGTCTVGLFNKPASRRAMGAPGPSCCPLSVVR